MTALQAGMSAGSATAVAPPDGSRGRKRWVRAKALAAMLGTSEQTVWRWAREKRMPAQIKLGPRMTAWDMSAIDDWLAKKAEGAAS